MLTFYLFIDDKFTETYSSAGYATGQGLYELVENNVGSIRIESRDYWLNKSDEYEDNFNSVLTKVKNLLPNISNEDYNEICGLLKKL